MKTIRLFPTLVMVIGVLFTCGGLVTTGAGIVIHGFVGEQLRAQQITTPADASIPNAPVTGIATALSMAALIQHHGISVRFWVKYTLALIFLIFVVQTLGITSNPRQNELRVHVARSRHITLFEGWQRFATNL